MLETSFILTSTAVFIVLYITSTIFADRLSHIPGPVTTRYSNLWNFIEGWRFRYAGGKDYEIRHHASLRAHYGNVVRRGPQTVVCYDPLAISMIYGIKARLDKSDAYAPFRQAGVKTSLLSIPDEATHSTYRKLVANAYSLSSIRPYEPNVDLIVNRLIEVCTEHAESEKPLNIGLWLYYFCFDNVSMITTGSDLGFMKGEGRDSFGLIERVKKFGTYAGIVANMPWLHYLLQENAVLRRTRPSPFFEVMRSIVTDRIQTQNEKAVARPDLLSHFVATHYAQPNIMDVKQVTISSSGNLIAGALSPGSTLSTLFRYMLIDPVMQERLHAELLQREISTPATFDSVKDIPYLNALLREALRMHPGALSGLERVVGERGLVLPDGTQIPPGIKISCPTAAISRDTGVYGQDARNFDPKRWIQKSNESLESFEDRRKMMDKSDLSFGQGSRTCIGKNVFMFEACKILASLFVLFKFELISTPDSSELMVCVRHLERE